jgi:2-polyprenyl-6-methoxyphenol hydroxylase-like FAD-dependent oxidoreductase
MVGDFDVCIRGGGITGRTLALLLARERLRVGLVVRDAPASTHDVRAYALNPASRDLLQGLRAWPGALDATPVLSMQVTGDDGGQLAFSAQEQHCEALNWIVDVPALEQVLAEAVRYQPQIEILPSPAGAALTVICEGRSAATDPALASRPGLDYEILPYAQQAIAARLECELPHGQTARQWFFSAASGNGILAFLPLGGAQGNSVAIVWSVHPERADGLMGLNDIDFAQEVQKASQGVLGQVSVQGQRARWPLQLMRARHWVGTGWALAGDAAHSVHPLSGQGLNLGLADVAELARILAAREYWRGLGEQRLLRRYERARKGDVALMAMATDGLQRLFAHADSRTQALRNWGLTGFDRSGPVKSWAVRQAMGHIS